MPAEVTSVEPGARRALDPEEGFDGDLFLACFGLLPSNEGFHLGILSGRGHSRKIEGTRSSGLTVRGMERKPIERLGVRLYCGL